MSDGEETLAFQLRMAKIPFVREYRFAPPRRWRFDFVVKDPYALDCDREACTKHGVAVEVEGGAYSGGHKRYSAADTDTEKSNAAVIAGWRVLRFTTAQAIDGRALQTIEQALGC